MTQPETTRDDLHTVILNYRCGHCGCTGQTTPAGIANDGHPLCPSPNCEIYMQEMSYLDTMVKQVTPFSLKNTDYLLQYVKNDQDTMSRFEFLESHLRKMEFGFEADAAMKDYVYGFMLDNVAESVDPADSMLRGVVQFFLGTVDWRNFRSRLIDSANPHPNRASDPLLERAGEYGQCEECDTELDEDYHSIELLSYCPDCCPECEGETR